MNRAHCRQVLDCGDERSESPLWLPSVAEGPDRQQRPTALKAATALRSVAAVQDAAAPITGSWPQLASNFWRFSLSMNRAHCRQVLDCGDERSESPLWLPPDAEGPDRQRRPTALKAATALRSVAAVQDAAAPITGSWSRFASKFWSCPLPMNLAFRALPSVLATFCCICNKRLYRQVHGPNAGWQHRGGFPWRPEKFLAVFSRNGAKETCLVPSRQNWAWRIKMPARTIFFRSAGRSSLPLCF